MDTNTLLDKLPDFDDMDLMAKRNVKAKADLERAKNMLEKEIARCIQEATLREEFWINNKPPSMSYADSVIAKMGNTPDDAKILESLREDVIRYSQEYELTKQILSNMETIIDIWRTYSANQRKVGL